MWPALPHLPSLPSVLFPGDGSAGRGVGFCASCSSGATWPNELCQRLSGDPETGGVSFWPCHSFSVRPCTSHSPPLGASVSTSGLRGRSPYSTRVGVKRERPLQTQHFWKGLQKGSDLSPRSYGRGATGLRFWPRCLMVTSANGLPLTSPLSLFIPGFPSCHGNLSRQNSKRE